MKHFRYVILVVLLAVGYLATGAQTVRNSSNSTVGYVRSDGRVENSSHSCIGYIRSDGRVGNSSHSCIGYVEGVSREWAAAFFFFFF